MGHLDLARPYSLYISVLATAMVLLKVIGVESKYV
jgi:hypothetical protein